jgi:hypothetical protein
MRRAAFALAVAAFALSALAQQAGSLFVREAIGMRSYAAAPRLAERAAMVPAVVLPPSATSVPDKIAAVQNWNAGGQQPMRNGFRRTLPDVAGMCPTPRFRQRAASRRSTRRDGSNRLRHDRVARWRVERRTAWLHLEKVTVPDGTVFWFTDRDDAEGIQPLLKDDKGAIWTPSVPGDTVYLTSKRPRP